MARPETLIPGNCYFSVGYYDSDLLLPTIVTLLYVGEDRDEDGQRMWVFEEPANPPDPDADLQGDEDRPLIGFTDAQLHQILDFPGLLSTLGEVAAEHPLHRLPEHAPVPATDAEFQSLPAELRRLLDSTGPQSLTMTIRFTDDGFSVGREADGSFAAHLFPHPRIEPEEAEKILALFANMGIAPTVDYLSDRGRTRVLQFPVPKDVDGIVRVCRRVLTEVYAMRQGDALDFHWHTGNAE
jgi:hypothetical protein